MIHQVICTGFIALLYRSLKPRPAYSSMRWMFAAISTFSALTMSGLWTLFHTYEILHQMQICQAQNPLPELFWCLANLFNVIMALFFVNRFVNNRPKWTPVSM